jgi:hypothetical protein
MDFSTLLESLQTTLGRSIPKLLLVLAILVVGWFLAVIIRAIVKKSLGLIRLNERVRSGAGGKMDLERGVALGFFYIVILLTLIAVFNALNLPLVSAPLQSLVDKVLDFLPNLIAAGVLILIAWILATILRKGTTRALAATGLDEKLSAEAGMKPMSENLGHVLYGLVLLLFLPAVLGALQLEGLLVPVRDMVNEILAMTPNLVASVTIALVGWFVARLLRTMVTGLLETAGANKIGERAGLKGTMTLSKLVGLIVFIFVLVPALIQALDVLEIEAISTPATQVLGTFMAAVPNLFAAAVILAVAFLLAGFVARLASDLLGGMGFDRVPENLGLRAAFPEGVTPSVVVGRIIIFFVVLFAVVEAAGVLGFTQLSGIVETFIEFGGQVLLGVLIIGVGLWMANLAHGAISRLDRPHARFMAGLARITILGVVFAMGLRAMDLANEIVNAAFYLTLGAVAVAVALSFGLGGREAAGRQMEHWFARLRGDDR